jgi:hypothetical protein
MTRILWIVGLIFALLVYGGISVIGVIALISHRHLNQTGIILLLSNGYVTWITFRYLVLKIRRAEPKPQSDGKKEEIEMPRLV